MGGVGGMLGGGGVVGGLRGLVGVWWGLGSGGGEG